MERVERPIRGKVVIEGIIHCETGLHIGASRESLEIGAIDSPVVRDPITREPYIPGSSLKGKLRSLLEKLLLENEIEVPGKGKYKITLNRKHKVTSSTIIWRHECDDWEPHKNKENEYPGAKYCPICRIFGSTKGREGKNWPARLIVRDAFMTRESKEWLENIETGLLYTEWKWENSLDRITASANPRQLERIPRGTEFEMQMIYTVENEEDIKSDLKNLKKALELLKFDYLGGHGSRGYGQIKIQNLKISALKCENGELKELQMEDNQDLTVKELNNAIQKIFTHFKTDAGSA